MVQFAHSNILINCIVFIVFYIRLSLACHSFQDVHATIKDVDGDEQKIPVEGCMDHFTIHNIEVKHVHFWNQKITRLEEGAVKNMPRLTKMSFTLCRLKHLYPGAFQNLPKFKEFSILGSRLKEISQGIFTNLPLKEIEIKLSRVEYIEDNAFANMGRLEKIKIADCDLEYWNSNWFKNSTNLQNINFYGNKIKVIPPFSFNNFPKLKKISFSHNKIEHIQPAAFQGLSTLEELDLEKNELTHIYSEAFPTYIRIGHLDLERNKLNYLPEAMFNNVVVKELIIDGNPWFCPCLDTINKWVQMNGGAILTDPYCVNSTIPTCLATETNFCDEVYNLDATKLYLDATRRKNHCFYDVD